ncbi:MAG: ADOP family duplicated permease [Gemmatimonadales bacterium]
MRPSFWRRIPGRWSYLLRIAVRRPEDDVDAELRFHLDERIAELLVQGASPESARAMAAQEFGDVDAVRARLNEIDRRIANRRRRAAWWESAAQDLRFTVRGLARAPGFTAIVVLTLALGIGANTALFSVMNHLLLQPLPYADGNRIVALHADQPGNPGVYFGVNAEILRLWQARSGTLEDFAAAVQRRYPFGGATEQDTLQVALITPSFLPMLRVQPLLGTGFTPDDARRGAPAVMMISYGLWQRRFGAARDVVGRVVNVDGSPRTIVGVVPKDVDIPTLDRDTTAVWLPLSLDSVAGFAFARLRRGVSSAAASAELQSLVKTLPDTGSLKGVRAQALSARDQVNPREQRAIEVLFAAVSGLLLIACANVANLLFMRAWTRQREFAIRRALGGGHLRLARQLLTESLVLTVSSGALGLLIAWSCLRVIVALGPMGPGQLNLAGVRIDGTVLAWAAGLSVVTGLLFGIGPTLLAGAHAVGAALRAGASGALGSVAAQRVRTGVVVGQVALSLIFLAAAGVLTRSFVALLRTPIGYDPAGLVAVHVQLARQAAPAEHADQAAIAQALTRALAAVPGVSEVAVGAVPQTTIAGTTVAIESPTGPRITDLSLFSGTLVGPEYFRVARIPLLQGRGFDATNVAADSREVVVNQTLAHRLWPKGNALNAQIRLGGAPDAPWLTVVGVAGDARMPGVKDDYWSLQLYRPSSAARRFAGSVLLRIQGNANALRPMIIRAVEGAGVSAKFQYIEEAEKTVYWALRGPRFAVTLFGLLAGVALVLSAAGLYGVVAFAVAQRTREIGIRMALGAEPRRVARVILGNGLRLAVGGCGIGVIGAYAATRALTALLYGVSPNDPIAFGGAVLLLIAVALIAAFVPMRRALRVDPADALRSD